jgi:hypothetical protein
LVCPLFVAGAGVCVSARDGTEGGAWRRRNSVVCAACRPGRPRAGCCPDINTPPPPSPDTHTHTNTHTHRHRHRRHRHRTQRVRGGGGAHAPARPPARGAWRPAGPPAP